MKQKWFRKAGWLYIPVHGAGYAIMVLAFIFMIPVIIAANRTAHSLTDMLYELFVYTTCTAFWWKWVAEKTSS